MSQAKLPLLLTVTALVAACSSTPTTPTAAPQTAQTSAPAPAQAPAAPQPQAASTVATVTLPPYLDPKSPLSSKRSVYFDFDTDTMKQDDTPVIEMHGKFLSANPSLNIRIEGNADERGSAEYNLALGQRRAQSVVKALEIFGVKSSQVEPVSYGEERPRAAGHDEDAWAQNRRADLVYPAK